MTPPTYPGEGYVTGCLSPDGRVRSAATNGRVTISEVANGTVRATSPDGVSAQSSPPVWSPDGSRIAFIGGEGDPTLSQDSWIYVLDAFTGEATRLVRADARANPTPSVVWSRDGATIYFTRGSYCTGGCTPGYLYRIAADGSGEEKLTDLRVLTLYGFAP